MSSKKAAVLFLTAMAASATVIAMSAPVAAQGSQNEMFRRHFFRGQAYHGAGHPAQVSELGRGPARGAGSAPLEAYVEDGSRGAAIADCAARFKSFDPATNTYVGRGGRRYSCR